VAFKVLLRLIHKRPDGRFPARLKGAVIGRVEVWNFLLIHDGSYDGGRDGAGHAGEGVHIDHPVVALIHVLQDSRNAEARFGPHVKGVDFFFP
jgi:hypothetical protein